VSIPDVEQLYPQVPLHTPIHVGYGLSPEGTVHKAASKFATVVGTDPCGVSPFVVVPMPTRRSFRSAK
jgi:hypothetical protein